MLLFDLKPFHRAGATALLTLLLSACGGGNNDPAQGGELPNPPPPTSGSWQLVWEDNFDGVSLDANSWEVQLGNGAAEGIPGWGNSELQYYQEGNITVDDGLLTIEARAESEQPGFDYTSGRIRTQGKVDFTFGRVEARIKVPSGQGLWSAFWLLGTDPSVYGGWPAKGEIDILEKYQPGFFSSALHYGGEFPQNKSVSGVFDDFEVADDFHVYAVEWDADFIRFFVDGQNFYTVGADTYYNYYFKNRNEGYVLGGDSAPFDEDHHIILNLAVGGNLPGAPNDPSVFPAQMQVDYVRLYECPVDASTGLGCRDSIDPVDDYISFDVDADAPVLSSAVLYKDGQARVFPGSDVERQLALQVYDNGGVFSATEVADEDGETVISVTTSGGGNVSLADVTGAPFNLVNMGSVDFPLSSADFKFDIKIDTAATDMAGDLQVKFDSGFPDVAFTSFAFSEISDEGWQQVSVPVQDILRGGRGAYGGGPADISALLNLITFEPTAAAQFKLNNIRLECGAIEFCGIQAIATQPLPVFVDDVAENFDRGIVGYDTVVNDNYTDSQGNHVSWEVVSADEDGIGNAIETTFSDSGASGVTFVGSSDAIDLSPWSEGEIAFEVRVLSNPNGYPMVFKLDGVDQATNSTGDVSIGILPVGEWRSIRVPLASLAASGFDLSDFAAFVLFPTFGGQDVVFQWANIRVEPTVSVQPEVVAVPIDFEADPVNYRFIPFEGGAAAVVPNPAVSVGNSSSGVVQLQKFTGATFAGVVLLLDEPVDFSAGEVFSLDVYSTRPADLTFKLEGLNIERVVPLAGEGWETVTADFSGATGAVNVEGLTFIVDNGTPGDAGNNPDDWTFYVDNIELLGAAPVPGQISRSDFEGANPNAGVIGGGWLVFANVFNANGDYLYGYGPFEAPNNTGAFSGVAALEGGDTQGNYALSVFSDYNNNDAHSAGDTVESVTFLEYIIGAEDSGTVTMSFDARKPAEGGVEPPASAFAYLQILDPNAGYSVTARVELDLTDLSADAWASRELALEIDGAALSGQILQYGFGSRSTDYAATGILVDNVVLAVTEGEVEPPVEPPSASFVFASDFEASDASAGVIGDNWLMFVNVFGSDGSSYLYGYGPFDAPNGSGAVSGIDAGEAGDAQGAQYLNVFSDYNNGEAHGDGSVLQTSVFREFVISEGDSGSYRFSFDAKRPAEGGLSAPSTAEAYVQVLDPNSGYSQTFYLAEDTSAVSTSEWQSFTIEFDIDASALAGQLIQFGFSNRAANYDPSGVYYDNIVVQEAENTPQAGLISSSDFEEADPNAGAIGGGWLVFANVFNANGDYLYGYGPFEAPNNTGAFSGVAALEGGDAQGNYALSVFSDYNNNDAHSAGDTVESVTFLEHIIGAEDSGTVTMSFDARKPAEGGVEPPASAFAYLQILDPNAGYSVTARVELDLTDLSADAWASRELALEIDGAALSGQILQYGFGSRSTDYAATGILVDNVVLAVTEGEVEPPVEPPSASFVFASDFEASDASAGVIGDNWLMFVNVFGSDGSSYLYGYGPFDAPNGSGAVSGIDAGEAGDAQGVQYLNVFSDYNNGEAHGDGSVLQTSVFREFVISEGDSGSYRFSFDAKRPAEGGLSAPSTAEAYVQVLDPNSGYSQTFYLAEDTSAVSTSEWQSFTIEFDIDASALAGQLIQFGFSNRAANYEPSGVYYDNVSVEGI